MWLSLLSHLAHAAQQSSSYYVIFVLRNMEAGSMKKIFLVMLSVVVVILAMVDIGVDVLLYLNPIGLLITLAGFYIWAASGDGAIRSLENLRRGADGAVLMSWISVLIGLIAVLAYSDPSDVRFIYSSLSVCLLPLFYGYLTKFLTRIFVD